MRVIEVIREYSSFFIISNQNAVFKEI